MEDHTAYDYRMYDSVWQRVSPGCDPYGEIHAAQNEQRSEPHSTPPPQAAQTLPAPVENEGTLPGAQLNPCCMGSAAMDSIKVLEGFIEEEIAQRRCYIALASRLCYGGAAQLLRALAQEKQTAVRDLKSAYYLITGSCYETIVSIDHMRWNSPADALRSIYHQEACNGFNYQRAADETVDPCLQKLFNRLSAQAFARADAVMELLGRILC